MEKFKVFYSWQSDLPYNKTRGFIKDCIDDAIKKAKSPDQIDKIEAERDEATLNTTGSPNIVTTLFSKIDEADLFVADVSLCFSSDLKGKRYSPNPNVLIELGYAVKTLGWERVICLCNTEFGDTYPFDIAHNRITSFELKDEKALIDARKRIKNIIHKNITKLRGQIPRAKAGLPQLVVRFGKEELRYSDDPLYGRVNYINTSPDGKTTYLKIIESSIRNVGEEYLPIDKSNIPIEFRKYINDDEISKYNNGLPPISKVKNYQKEYEDYSRILNAGIAACVVIENKGNVKASDISVDIRFPDDIKVIRIDCVEDYPWPRKPNKLYEFEELITSAFNRSKEEACKRVFGSSYDEIVQYTDEWENTIYDEDAEYKGVNNKYYELYPPMYDGTEFDEEDMPVQPSYKDYLGQDRHDRFNVSRGLLISDNTVKIKERHGIVHYNKEEFYGLYLVPYKKGVFSIKAEIMCAEFKKPEIVELKLICK